MKRLVVLGALVGAMLLPAQSVLAGESTFQATTRWGSWFSHTFQVSTAGTVTATATFAAKVNGDYMLRVMRFIDCADQYSSDQVALVQGPTSPLAVNLETGPAAPGGCFKVEFAPISGGRTDVSVTLTTP